MPIENVSTNMKTKAGRPNHAKLAEQGRLPKPVAKNGTVFDPNPAPKVEIQGKPVSRGYAKEADGIWRVGYSAAEHHEQVLLSQSRKSSGKDWDFLPELYDEELADYTKYVEAQEKKTKEIK